MCIEIRAVEVLRVDLDWSGVIVYKGLATIRHLRAGGGHMAGRPGGIIGEMNGKDRAC